MNRKVFIVGCFLVSLCLTKPAQAQNVFTENHELGTFVHQESPKTGPKLQERRIVPTEAPRVDFIDISAWSGEISTEQFTQMKAQGVKGVVVKLTEGTTYRNPLAPQQIANAKAAGLKVSTYHFSWFENEQEAIDQANYYADYAEELGLSKDTVMVNDAEAPVLIPVDATKVSLYFKKQLESRGYQNIIHYASASWFSNNWMEYDVLGKENSWVAQWPTTPSADHLLHEDTASWQWSNQGSFAFLPGVKVDFNMDYLGRFTNQLLAVGIEDYSPYVYLNLTREQFTGNQRFLVYVDGQYYFETYQGVNYYSYQKVLKDGICQIRRPFTGKQGQRIELYLASGQPGMPSEGKKLLESYVLKEKLATQLPELSQAVAEIAYTHDQLKITYQREIFEGDYRLIVSVNGTYVAEVYHNTSYYASINTRTNEYVETVQKIDLQPGAIVSVSLHSGTPGEATEQSEILKTFEVQ